MPSTSTCRSLRRLDSPIDESHGYLEQRKKIEGHVPNQEQGYEAGSYASQGSFCPRISLSCQCQDSSRETGQREAAVCRTNRDPKNRRSGKTSTAAHSAGGNRHERAYGTETAASGPHCPDTDTAQLYRKVGTSSGQRKRSGSNPTVRKKIQAQTEICT